MGRLNWRISIRITKYSILKNGTGIFKAER